MSNLQRLEPNQVRRATTATLDAETLARCTEIVDAVRRDGDRALFELSERFGDAPPEGRWRYDAKDLAPVLESLSDDERAVLERTHERIVRFARAQLETLMPLEAAIAGGRAGHDLVPIASAGCYAPGGRYPLPSSVLMTAATARAAGVERVVVVSPKPTACTLAAAALAGADELWAVGGAQAIAALAYGTESLEPVDFICGPGNRWVTAAKKLVYGDVGIDGLAGPSELLVLADETADPATVAADLIAQAEHDADARPILVTTSARLADEVDGELELQLEALSDATARQAIDQGFAVVARDLDEALRVSQSVAPEHLEVLMSEPQTIGRRLRHAGALFLGSVAAEVLGDYGAGPNHVLPTGGGSRFRGGLSVLDFVRVRTWLELDPSDERFPDLVDDAARLARIEGLEGHARSAERRTTSLMM